MKNFTVTWHYAARAALANLYLTDPDPAAITAASDEIDRRLGINPTHQAVAVEEGCYELTILRVLFRVRHHDRVVEVLRLKRI